MASTNENQWTDNSQGYGNNYAEGGDDFNFVADPVPANGEDVSYHQ